MHNDKQPTANTPNWTAEQWNQYYAASIVYDEARRAWEIARTALAEAEAVYKDKFGRRGEGKACANLMRAQMREQEAEALVRTTFAATCIF